MPPRTEKHSDPNVLMRKPEIVNFVDPYHRNCISQVSENDVVRIGYWKKCNFAREGCSKLKKQVFVDWQDISKHERETCVCCLGTVHVSERIPFFLMGHYKFKWPFCMGGPTKKENRKL